MLGLGQTALVFVTLFCFCMIALLAMAWSTKDIAEEDQYRYYRGIDLSLMPDTTLVEKIKWLKLQEPTDGGLRITDSSFASKVILAYERCHRNSAQ